MGFGVERVLGPGELSYLASVLAPPTIPPSRRGPNAGGRQFHKSLRRNSRRSSDIVAFADFVSPSLRLKARVWNPEGDNQGLTRTNTILSRVELLDRLRIHAGRARIGFDRFVRAASCGTQRSHCNVGKDYRLRYVARRNVCFDCRACSPANLHSTKASGRATSSSDLRSAATPNNR